MTQQHFFYMVVAGAPTDQDVDGGVMTPRYRCGRIAAALKIQCGIGPHLAIVSSDDSSRTVFFEMQKMLGSLVKGRYPAHRLDEQIVPKLQAGEIRAAGIFRDEISRVIRDAVMVNGVAGKELAVLIYTATPREYMQGMMGPVDIDWGYVQSLDVIAGEISSGGVITKAVLLGAIDMKEEFAGV